MADDCMPEKFYELAFPILPPEKEVGRKGGRPLSRRSPQKRHEIHVAGRSRRRSAGDSRRASQSDQLEFVPAVLEFPEIGGKSGRPLTHLKKLYGDVGFESEAAPLFLVRLGIETHIRHRNADHGSHVGRVRWVVKRTSSWVKELRRMRVRYDRSPRLLGVKARQSHLDPRTVLQAA